MDYDWVSVKHTARMLGVDKQVVYRMIHSDTVVWKKIGGRYRIATTDGVVIQIMDGEYRPRHLREDED